MELSMELGRWALPHTALSQKSSVFSSLSRVLRVITLSRPGEASANRGGNILLMHCGPEQPKIQSEELNHSSSVCSFARTAHLFAGSALLASLVRSTVLTRSLAHFAHSLARGTVNDWMAI